MTAILSPPSDVAIESIDHHGVHRDALATLDLMEQAGLHLQAAAGFAVIGSHLASLVADDERRRYARAVREWGDDNDLDHLAALSSGMR